MSRARNRKAIVNLITIASIIVIIVGAFLIGRWTAPPLHLVSDPLPDALTIGRDLDRPDCLAIYFGGAKAEVIAPDDPRFKRLQDFIQEWQ